MQLFEEKKILYTFVVALLLWVLLPLTTQTTRNTSFLQFGSGYAPVANFYNHPNPPKIRSREYKQVVWRHERYAFFWLPFSGNKAGEYGLLHVYRGRSSLPRFRFLPLTFEQAGKIAAEVNVKLEPEFLVSSWSLYFGWLVLLPFALIFYWDRRFYSKLIGFL